MRALALHEIEFVGGGNAKDTTSGTFEGTNSPSGTSITIIGDSQSGYAGIGSGSNMVAEMCGALGDIGGALGEAAAAATVCRATPAPAACANAAGNLTNIVVNACCQSGGDCLNNPNPPQPGSTPHGPFDGGGAGGGY
jgi:hypothetical protein